MPLTCCGAGHVGDRSRAASSSAEEDKRVGAFTVVATVAAVIAGAIASISGFGIGSVLTPVLSTQFDVRLAIAMVSLPHLAGTFVRLLIVRTRINREVLLGFGAASAGASRSISRPREPISPAIGRSSWCSPSARSWARWLGGAHSDE